MTDLSEDALTLLHEYVADLPAASPLAARHPISVDATRVAAAAEMRRDATRFARAAAELGAALAVDFATFTVADLGTRLTVPYEESLARSALAALLAEGQQSEFVSNFTLWQPTAAAVTAPDAAAAAAWQTFELFVRQPDLSQNRRSLADIVAAIRSAEPPEALAELCRRVLAQHAPAVDATARSAPAPAEPTTEEPTAAPTETSTDGSADPTTARAQPADAYAEMTAEPSLAAALALLVEHGSLSSADLVRIAESPRLRHRFSAQLDTWMTQLGLDYRVVVTDVGTVYTCEP